MTLITMQGGAVVMRDGKVGTEQACCCGEPCQCSATLYSSGALDGKVSVSFDVEFLQLGVTNTCVGQHNLPTQTLAWNDPHFYYEYTSPGWTGSLRCDITCLGGQWQIVWTIVRDLADCAISGAYSYGNISSVSSAYDIVLDTQVVDGECYPASGTFSQDFTTMGIGLKVQTTVTVTP